MQGHSAFCDKDGTHSRIRCFAVHRDISGPSSALQSFGACDTVPPQRLARSAGRKPNADRVLSKHMTGCRASSASPEAPVHSVFTKSGTASLIAPVIPRNTLLSAAFAHSAGPEESAPAQRVIWCSMGNSVLSPTRRCTKHRAGAFEEAPRPIDSFAAYVSSIFM